MATCMSFLHTCPDQSNRESVTTRDGNHNQRNFLRSGAVDACVQLRNCNPPKLQPKSCDLDQYRTCHPDVVKCKSGLQVDTADLSV